MWIIFSCLINETNDRRNKKKSLTRSLFENWRMLCETNVRAVFPFCNLQSVRTYTRASDCQILKLFPVCWKIWKGIPKNYAAWFSIIVRERVKPTWFFFGEALCLGNFYCWTRKWMRTRESYGVNNQRKKEGAVTVALWKGFWVARFLEKFYFLVFGNKETGSVKSFKLIHFRIVQSLMTRFSFEERVVECEILEFPKN